MAVWALADLHLSFGVPNKEMDVFGEQWHDHGTKIKERWLERIAPTDLVLLAGDISWGMTPDQAKPDLDWIAALPGTKVLVKGNHDYWWSSLGKAQQVLQPSMHLIQNNTFMWNQIGIGGTRLWDTPEYGFSEYIPMKEYTTIKHTPVDEHQDDEKIFVRELGRLENSLRAIPKHAAIRIAMTHYPPIGPDLKPTRATALLKKYGINVCVFGHLHGVIKDSLPFGELDGIRYIYTACDYVNFTPVKIFA